VSAPDCPGCAKVARHPGEGYRCIPHDYPPFTPTLTPAERTLAKVLAAWEEWPCGDDEYGGDVAAMADVGDLLVEHGLARVGALTDAGRDLLNRARKAGVLP
jgi:hypothetical protein